MTMINVPQRCKHPGCFVPIYDDNDFMYLPVAEIEKQLGRKVVEKDLRDFPVHVVHGGVTLESNERFLRTFYQGRPLVFDTKRQKMSAPVAKVSTLALKDRMIALNVKYGLSSTELEVAINQNRTEGTNIELAMRLISERKALIAQLGLTSYDVVSARLKCMAENISIEEAMRRIGTSKRLHAAKRAKNTAAQPAA